MKQVFVALAFVGILVSLGSALVFMLKRDPQGEGDDSRRAGRMMRSLALRVGLSIVLFLCILLAWKLGYLQPSGISSQP